MHYELSVNRMGYLWAPIPLSSIILHGNTVAVKSNLWRIKMFVSINGNTISEYSIYYLISLDVPYVIFTIFRVNLAKMQAPFVLRMRNCQWASKYVRIYDKYTCLPKFEVQDVLCILIISGTLTLSY